MRRPKWATRKTPRQRSRINRVRRAAHAEQLVRAEANVAAKQAEADAIAQREARIERMCTSKKRYASEESARAAAIDEGKYHYKCHPPADCGGWHLTSKALDEAPRPRKADADVEPAT